MTVGVQTGHAVLPKVISGRYFDGEHLFNDGKCTAPIDKQTPSPLKNKNTVGYVPHAQHTAHNWKSLMHIIVASMETSI